MRFADGLAVSKCDLEILEARRLLTTASVNASHVLNISGTDGADVIIVNKLSNGKVSVSGVAGQFTPGAGSKQFNKINISALGGNDSVQINNNVPYTSATISGGKGSDKLTGGKGNDSINGDQDNDSLDGGGAGADALIGGSGFDTANYSYRTDNLTLSLDNKANDGANKGAEKDNVQTEEVFGGLGNDSMTGSGADDFLAGGAGNDTIRGMGGNDDLIGATGADQIFGNDGDDLLQAKNQDRDTVNGGSNSDGTSDFDLAAVDSLDVPGAAPASAALAVALATESFDVEQFITDDQLSGENTLLPLTKRLANLSNAALWYTRAQPNSDGVATINLGNEGNTILFSNITVGGTPLLALSVNGVQITFDPKTTTQIVINVGSGNDDIEAGDQTTIPLLIHAGDGNDTVVGGSANDSIFGGEGNDSLSGGRSADVVVGGAGNDSLFGNDGRDILIGGEHADNLYGNDGEDILIGGSTAYDENPDALGRISSEWRSSHTNQQRITNLRSGGGLNGSFTLTTDIGRTVFVDKGNNFLNGGYNRDWFFKGATDSSRQGAGEEFDKV